MVIIINVFLILIVSSLNSVFNVLKVLNSVNPVFGEPF